MHSCAAASPFPEYGLISVLPDDLAVVGLASGVVVGLASVVLVAVSFLFGLL